MVRSFALSIKSVLLGVISRKVGEWVGVCKADRGKPCKVGGCSSECFKTTKDLRPKMPESASNARNEQIKSLATLKIRD